MLERAGRANDALPLYFGAIFAAQGAGQWLGDATTPPGLRPLVLHAMRTVGGRPSAAVLESARTAARSVMARLAMARVEKCLAVYLTELPANYPDPKQRPKFLYFPDLPTKKFYEPELFPWYAELEAQTAAIRDEMLAVLAEDSGFEPFLGHFDDDKLEGHLANANGGRRSGMRSSSIATARVTRRTTRAVRSTSAALGQRAALPRARSFARSLLFGADRGLAHPAAPWRHQHAAGHASWRWSCPEDCALVVGGEAHGWEEGRCFTFDDTFEHEAWNRSDRTRVVMLMDIWNPYLTEVEREALTTLVPAIGEFNCGRQSEAAADSLSGSIVDRRRCRRRASDSSLARRQRDQQRDAEHDAIHRERREAVRADVAEQPFHRDERGDQRNDERDRERAPVLVRAAVLCDFINS